MNPPTRTAILDVQGLSFAHPGQPALASDWSATLAAGVTLVHGDTGSGKTTLLRVLAGELPAGGRLTLAGARLDADAGAYRRQVLRIDPATDAFDPLSARAATAALGAGDAGFRADDWQALAEGFALTPHLDKPLYMLSTGSKRKVWLAAALASGRPLILLDEPAAALDGPSIACLRRALERAAARNDQAIVVASAERLERVALTATLELPLR